MSYPQLEDRWLEATLSFKYTPLTEEELGFIRKLESESNVVRFDKDFIYSVNPTTDGAIKVYERDSLPKG